MLPGIDPALLDDNHPPRLGEAEESRETRPTILADGDAEVVRGVSREGFQNQDARPIASRSGALPVQRERELKQVGWSFAVLTCRHAVCSLTHSAIIAV